MGIEDEANREREFIVGWDCVAMSQCPDCWEDGPKCRCKGGE